MYDEMHQPKRDTTREVVSAEERLRSMPDLHQADESPVDLSSEYWSPSQMGEYKVGIPMAIEDHFYENRETGEEVPLPCVILIEQTPDGDLRVIRNGSVRLVATIENSVKAGHITLGETPIKIIYQGRHKNANNQHLSDRWSVKPLIVKDRV